MIINLRSRFAAMLLILGVQVSETAYCDHQNIYSDQTVLKLDDLINEALKNNAALRSSERTKDIKDAATGVAGFYDSPELGFEANNYPVRYRDASSSVMRERQISLSQRVPFPGKLGRLEEAARKEAEAQQDETRSARLLLIKDIKLAYYELFVAYRSYEILTNQQNIVRGLISTAGKQYSLGKIPQAEVLGLQLEETTLINQLLSADRKIKETLGELNHLVGRSDHHQYIAGKPAEIKMKPFKFDETSEAKIFELAVQKNPKLSSRRALVAASESRVDYARLNLWPDFNVKVGYTFRDVGPDQENANSMSAMVGMTLPLWGGSRESAERRRAIAENAEEKSKIDDEQIDLAHRVHVAYAQLEESHQRVKLLEEAIIPLSQQALSSAQNGYLTGKVVFATLLNLIQKKTQIEFEYVEALATYQMKIAEIEALTGEFGEHI